MAFQTTFRGSCLYSNMFLMDSGRFVEILVKILNTVFEKSPLNWGLPVPRMVSSDFPCQPWLSRQHSGTVAYANMFLMDSGRYVEILVKILNTVFEILSFKCRNAQFGGDFGGKMLIVEAMLSPRCWQSFLDIARWWANC